jgi:hypothetical protein
VSAVPCPRVKLQPLAQYRHQVCIGQPLPFGVCDAEGRQLLARGQVIDSEQQYDALLERGAFVDRTEIDDTAVRITMARPEELPALWSSSIDRIGRVLCASVDADFPQALERAAQPVMALVARDPDLAIFAIVRNERAHTGGYASRHAVHAAIASTLAARRLAWDEAARRCIFRAALTMNLSLADLQNRLAMQVTPVTAAQREQIQSHPQRSVELLQAAGVTDREWLDAVLKHHVHAGGTGYPRGLSDVGEIALLLQRADVFTAKFSARHMRLALAPDVAARQTYAAYSGDPMVVALVDEFGIYPPGSAVRLKSGEMGVVVQRGEQAHTPRVAVLCNRRGEALATPLRRDTAQPEHAVAGAVSIAALKVRTTLERLAEMVRA